MTDELTEPKNLLELVAKAHSDGYVKALDDIHNFILELINENQTS